MIVIIRDFTSQKHRTCEPVKVVNLYIFIYIYIYILLMTFVLFPLLDSLLILRHLIPLFFLLNSSRFLSLESYRQDERITKTALGI